MNIVEFLKAFTLEPSHSLDNAPEAPRQTEVEWVEVDGRRYPRLINEYWTSRQRQSSSLHEIAYRACFKAQLPRFFIRLLTSPGDVVYDPFSGRGTTIIEAALLNRRVIANDINPLSEILCRPRLFIPRLSEIETRLNEIPVDSQATADRDLSMFYHPRTEAEIVSLRRYLHRRRLTGNEDAVDAWIRMVATNRLTGHSPGFFSVYTLPPNQAVSPERQRLINARRNQQPPYRNTRALILRKSRSLLRHIDESLRRQLHALGASARFLTADARSTPEIPSQSVDLIVTSPPFLNVVQYAADNWLRCWFNHIDAEEVARRITQVSRLEEWLEIMEACFREFYRIVKPGGWIAFEVGEVRNGRVRLDEHVAPIGEKAGFRCQAIVINRQQFTKTSNIWGVQNNRKGTNTNRVVLFRK